MLSPTIAVLSGTRFRTLWTAGLLLALAIWSYWPTLTDLVEFWRRNEDYSAGQLVPFVAVYLLWRERKHLASVAIRPSWWGAALLLASQIVRFAGIYYAFGFLERLSLVLLLSSLILLVFGGATFRRLIWVQAFLLLVLPPPQQIHRLLALPLQDWATALGKFGLELLGFWVTREGNVLRVDRQAAVLVGEACSGLRMLTAFVLTAAVLCFMVRRPALHKIVLLASSLPIAVLANGLRVLVTSACVYGSGDATFEQRFHDAAGLAMMPLAVLILLGELMLLAQVTRLCDGESSSDGGRRAEEPSAS